MEELHLVRIAARTQLADDVVGLRLDHRDDLLTEEERVAGEMLICVSRASCARLVLDILPPR